MAKQKPRSKTTQTRFVYQLQAMGLRKMLFSTDLILSLVVAIALLIDYNVLDNKLFNTLDTATLSAIVGVSSTIFAIIIATLAIIMSFSSSKFITFLNQKQKLSVILFSFWLASGTYLLVILLILLDFIFNTQSTSWAKETFNILIISLFIYALLQTFYVLATVLRFAYFIHDYEPQLIKKKSNSNPSKK